jgi:hypothetical protein
VSDLREYLAVVSDPRAGRGVGHALGAKTSEITWFAPLLNRID